MGISFSHNDLVSHKLQDSISVGALIVSPPYTVFANERVFKGH